MNTLKVMAMFSFALALGACTAEKKPTDDDKNFSVSLYAVDVEDSQGNAVSVDVSGINQSGTLASQ